MSFIGDHIGALLTFIAQDFSTPLTKLPKRDSGLFERIRDCMYQQSSHARCVQRTLRPR